VKIPITWLCELLPGLAADAGSPLEVAERAAAVLDGLGLPVEQIEEHPAPPDGVVVGRVESVSGVPDSDHLKSAVVSDGGTTRRIVTGAPNARAGMLTALAPVGVTLPGQSSPVTAREMAGQPSEGVLCSPRELGLYDDGSGLCDFGAGDRGGDARPGQALRALWPAEVVLSLEITPNRADAFSLLGVARDLAAKLGLELVDPSRGLDTGRAVAGDAADAAIQVRVDDTGACPRFTARLIEDVEIRPSPLWLQRRLASVGLRPRNNVVDVTNFVTFELGQPSHAYDLADLAGQTLGVRRARPSERLTTLTEQDLELTPEDLVITTGRDPASDLAVGLGGIIGGLSHSVKPTTRSVALEVAHFDPVLVHRTAKRHRMITDAHYRFERGVDPNLVPRASARAAALIAELGGGRVHPVLTDVGGDRPKRRATFRPSRVSFLMDVEIDASRQRAYLEALGMEVEARTEDEWTITIPTHRFDLAIEEDFIEEVSRLHGYEHIPETIPAMHFVPSSHDPTHRALRTVLCGIGFQETISYVFSGDDELSRVAAPPAVVRLAHPPNVERSVLRTALYPSLLTAARHNRGTAGLALFEIGRVFGATEVERLCLLASGAWQPATWRPERRVDFFLFKGLLEKLASTLGADLALDVEPHPALHPGVSARVTWGGAPIGFVGRIHPRVEAELELDTTFVAELDLPLSSPPIRFTEAARQPHADRDVAVIAPRDVSYASLEDLVRGAAGERLEWVRPFDVYEGKPIPDDKRSVALRMRFRHPERALQEDELDAALKRVIDAIAASGFEVRSK
jgi:phenylalanyl-tRNA synthetase beta chain